MIVFAIIAAFTAGLFAGIWMTGEASAHRVEKLFGRNAKKLFMSVEEKE